MLKERVGFTRPDTESVAYRRLWKHLNKEQREMLVEYNRVPVYLGDGRLCVIPYSRFHNRTYNI